MRIHRRVAITGMILLVPHVVPRSSRAMVQKRYPRGHRALFVSKIALTAAATACPPP